MMRPCYNVLSPSNGDVILKPTQDMVIGCYYLTLMIFKNNYSIQKWFTNEKDVLGAFYQKKITLHTPVLVRYSMLNFEFKLEEKKVRFSSKTNFLKTNEKDVFLYKIFQVRKDYPKYYLITNIGILIAYYRYKNKYELTDLFLETTPGRILFCMNFKNSIN